MIHGLPENSLMYPPTINTTVDYPTDSRPVASASPWVWMKAAEHNLQDVESRDGNRGGGDVSGCTHRRLSQASIRVNGRSSGSTCHVARRDGGVRVGEEGGPAEKEGGCAVMGVRDFWGVAVPN